MRERPSVWRTNTPKGMAGQSFRQDYGCFFLYCRLCHGAVYLEVMVAFNAQMQYNMWTFTTEYNYYSG